MKIGKKKRPGKVNELQAFKEALAKPTNPPATLREAKNLYDAIKLDPSVTASTSGTWRTNWFYPEAKPKQGIFANMSPEAEKLVKQILAGLARQNGGSIVLTESELGDEDDQMVLDVNEKAGLVTITLLPDYVQIGDEPAEGVDEAKVGDFTIKWDSTGLYTVGPSTTNVNTVDPLTVTINGSTVNWNMALFYEDKP